MNPFKGLIESSRDSTLYSPDAVRRMIDELKNNGYNAQVEISAAPDTDPETEADPETEYAFEEEGFDEEGSGLDEGNEEDSWDLDNFEDADQGVVQEVHELLARLRELVGDFDAQCILDRLPASRSASRSFYAGSPILQARPFSDSGALVTWGTGEEGEGDLSREEAKEEPGPCGPYLGGPYLGGNRRLTLSLDDADTPGPGFSSSLPAPMSLNLDGARLLRKQWSGQSRGGVVGGLGGSTKGPVSNTRRSRRYSLGTNRFSTSARKLSVDTLGYINGPKIPRTNTALSLASEAELGQGPLACATPLSLFPPSPPTSTRGSGFWDVVGEQEVSGPTAGIFTEFSCIGVEQRLLDGEELALGTLQPTEMRLLYPVGPSSSAPVPMVGNLHEYCFPQGAELRYVTRRELDQLSTAPPRYQVMQFTDASYTVFYAACVVVTEPVSRPSQELLARLDDLQACVVAANTIKQYARFYLYRKRCRQERDLAAQWEENISISNSNSRNASMAGPSEAPQSSSLFRALKNALYGKGGRASRKSKGHRRKSTGAEAEAEAEAGAVRELKQRCVSEDTTFRPSEDWGAEAELGAALRAELAVVKSSPTKDRKLSSLVVTDSARDMRASASGSTLGSAPSEGGSPSRGTRDGLRALLSRSSAKVAVVAQRAYCIISTQPLHPTLFRVLEAVAARERERALLLCQIVRAPLPAPLPAALASRGGGLGSSGNRDPDGDHAHEEKRLAFLQRLHQADLSALTPRSPSRTTDRQSVRYVELGQPNTYIPSLRIPSGLALREWTCALLFSVIPADTVVSILSLLLQEQSLLVYGSDAGLVTALATAFMLLLQPLTWEGIFVPLLPAAAYEALDAPVPYIIGVVSTSRPSVTIAPNAGLLGCDAFVLHPELYQPLTVTRAAPNSALEVHQRLASAHPRKRHRRSVDLPEKESPAAPNPRMGMSLGKGLGLDAGAGGEPLGSENLPLFVPPAPSLLAVSDPFECAQFSRLQRELAHHAAKVRQSLKHPRTGLSLWSAGTSTGTGTGAGTGSNGSSGSEFSLDRATAVIKAAMFELSPESQRALRLALVGVRQCVESLCGDVLLHSGAWRQYGAPSKRTQQFEFVPDLFLAPLRAALRLQESVINTQLFVSFIDQRSAQFKRQGGSRRFIADWVSYRLHVRGLRGMGVMGKRHSVRKW